MDEVELEIMLKDCGFKNIRKIKAFDRESLPDENDEAIVYECKKWQKENYSFLN